MLPVAARAAGRAPRAGRGSRRRIVSARSLKMRRPRVEVAQAHHGTQRLVGAAVRRTRRARSARGSSTSTVPVPTSITSHCARSRCASTPRGVRGDPPAGPVGGGAATVEGGGELPGDEGAVVLHRRRSRPGSAPAPRAPSGRTRPRRRPRAAWSRRRPRSGWGRAARTRRARPRPRPAPAAHGPVRPVWLQGSSVTTAVAPRASAPASARAAASACGLPAPRW